MSLAASEFAVNFTACSSARGLHRRLLPLQVVNLLLNVVAGLLLAVILRNKRIRRLGALVNWNLRILFFSAAFLFAFTILAAIAPSIYLLAYTLRAHSNACDFIWDGLDCFGMRAPVFVSFFGINLLHFALFVERLKTTVLPNRWSGCWLGIGLSFFVIVAPIVLMLSAYHNEDLHVPRLYCTLGGDSPISSVHEVVKVMAVFNVFTSVGDFCLFLRNRRQIKSKLNDYRSYTLTAAFQLRENQASFFHLRKHDW
ncbi:hypothetical protein M3Y99_00571000 [Aphelenchoides fujianensis]|nr:hypothetical protein M3Y99_00571000 [Aphelenchoides fujianensis]